MESKFGNTENYRVLIRDKKGAYLLHPFKSKTEKTFKIEECSSILASKKYFSILNEGKLTLYSTKDCSIFKEFDLNQVVAVDFYLKDKYLITIQKPVVEKNLKIFDLSNNCQLLNEFRSQTHPHNEWPQIKISQNEKYIYFHNKTSLEIYDQNKNCIHKLENVLGFEDIQIEDRHLLIVSTFAFRGNKGKKDCNFAAYDFKDFSKPIKENNTSYTDRVKIKVSLDNKYILINTINDNTSNKSYYGQSNIYFYEILTGRFTKFNLPEGPIHDFNWCPDGEHFIICAGHLPSTVKYYKKTGDFEKDIAKGNFNTIKISPDSRIVALCGFGSLKGDIEFYSLKDYSLIGKNTFFCCVNFEWSQDSKYIIGAVLSTRVKVDNEYRIMKYNGEEVVIDKNVGEIYDSIFIYEENKDLIGYDEFKIEKNAKSLEQKKKEPTGGIKLTSTLGKIDFSNKSKSNPIDEGGIVGLGKKKKKKKQK